MDKKKEVMKENKILLIFIFFLIGIPFIQAGVGSDTISNKGVKINIPDIPINYSLIPTVNNSQYWDGNAWSNVRWLDIDGGNANQNINIGAYNFTTSGIGQFGEISLEFGDLVSEQNPDGADAIRLKGTASDVDVVLGQASGYFSVWNAADNTAVFYVDDRGDTDIEGNLLVVGTVTGSNLNISNWNNAYTHKSSDGSDHSWIDQPVLTTSSPTFNNPIVNGIDLNLGGGQTMQLVGTGASSVILTFSVTAGGGATLTMAGNAALNQNLRTGDSPSFVGVTASGTVQAEHLYSTDDAVIDDNLRVNGHVGIGTNAGTDVWEVLNMEFNRPNNFGGWYIENTASDGITRFSVGMNHVTGTKGVLFQYDNEDGRALVLNRKATIGTMELSTTGGGVKVWNNGNVQIAQAYTNDIGTERDLLINASGDLGYDSSSIVFKENIKNMTNEMSSKVYDLRPVTYDKINGSKNQIGLIAEDVYKLYPEFISYKREEIWGDVCIAPDDCYYGVSGYQMSINKTTGELIPETISYKKLVIPLIQEVQNLKVENDLLKSCIINSKDFIEMKECVGNE